MPRPLSSESQQTIMGAVQRVAELVTGGEHPDDASVKAASEAGLPPGHIPLLTTAYNIGRTAVQRTSGTTTMEKAADFPLASAENVLERLYPTKIKSAHATRREEGISSVYLEPPTWLERHYMAEGRDAVLKAAEAVTPQYEAPPLSDTRKLAVEVGDARRVDRARDTARLAMHEAQDDLQAKMASLADTIATSGLMISDIRDNIAAMYGDTGTALLDVIEDQSPGVARSLIKHAHMVQRDREPYAAIAAIFAQSATVATLKQAYVQAEALASRGRVQLPSPDESMLDRRLRLKAARISDGLTYGMGAGAIEQAANSFVPPDRDTSVEKTLAQIATPSHERMLSQIEARAHLSQLFNNDEVLSGHDPEEVATHFNRLSATTPHVSRSSLLATPIVRKSVSQGQLDPFDAGEVVGSENKLRSLHDARRSS